MLVRRTIKFVQEYVFPVQSSAPFIFRVGKDNQSECAKWLTDMAKNLLAPIPFREVFVIFATHIP